MKGNALIVLKLIFQEGFNTIVFRIYLKIK